VSKILVGEGEVVPVGTVLVVIGGDSPNQVSDTKTRATPLVRRLAQELGVDLDAVAGTGPQGRITEQDVRGAAGPKEGRREPVRGIRRQMFEHLTKAHAVPTITWVEECDFTGADLKLLVPLVLKACAESLKEFPELNARVEDHDLVYLDRYDIGVAVQTEQGLVVPVVRGCEARSIEELDADVRRLADAAHAGTLAPEELRGGTFTITSAGRSAGLFTTTLLNHPEVAILGVHRIEERAVVCDGEVVVRRMGNVSLTFDHRVIDGKRAADFGLSVISRLGDRGSAA
jgi:pyruvate/2-oxoglutarate dehydrogenase complex dihydrolipoamide acyltransferase (E2) component